MPFNLQWSKKLLPIKGHFFFFNAGTAPLVPYLSTYARQLGFSSTTVGLIYTVLPIFGLFAKPLFGVIADRFKKQKSLFILFQVVTIVSFSAIYFIPAGDQPVVTVGLSCDLETQTTVIRSCFNESHTLDSCKVEAMKNENSVAMCQMDCDMSSPSMWEMVCANWHIPHLCYSSTDNIEFTTHLDKVTTTADCGYISAANVTLDGSTYASGCHKGPEYIDINEPCKMHCVNAQLTEAIGGEYVNVTCIDNILSYRTCANVTKMKMLTNGSLYSSGCEIYCELDKYKPWKLMEMCKGWGAGEEDSCHPRLDTGLLFPKNLSFIAAVPLSTSDSENNCIHMQLNYIEVLFGHIIYPKCVSDTKPLATEVFQTSCEISCDHELVNRILMEAMESNIEEGSPYTEQFWLFFMLMIISWIGQAVVVTFADAICFNLLGPKVSHYGKQRLWGSVGWGIFSLLTGTLIDVFSDGAVKNYTVAFVLMFVFMTGDVIVSSFLKIESTKMSLSILADIGTLLSSIPTFIFLLWTIAVGLCTGLLWQFLFWLIEDVSNLKCDGAEHVKTLQGLVSAIQTFCGEIPFLFVSGYILRKVGHGNMMSIVLFAFGVRFILYSTLSNPWWVLPIEMFQGVTFGMFYPTMTSYANIVSPQGTETTVQGLVGAVFEGVGVSLGSFIGGQLYEKHGGWKTFRWFGYGSLFCCFLHVIGQYALKRRSTVTAEATQGNETGDVDTFKY